MPKPESPNPDPADWRSLYRVAIFETNETEKMNRISDAEEAMVECFCQIFRDTGSAAQGEREAIDDAMYAPRSWRASLENRTTAA